MVCCGHSSLLWAMSFAAFHPIVQRWFTTAIGTPTSAQLSGWASIRDGRHTLIAAPTGSGKTLAAFLSALDELTRDALVAPLADEVRVVYVSPPKARRAPCALPRAPAAGCRTSAPAHRPVGHAEANRGGRELSDRRRQLHGDRRRTPPRDGPRGRDPAVAARRRDGARSLGGILRPAGGADSRPPD